MIPRTKVQARTLRVIRDLTVDEVPPTMQEIGMALGLASRSGVHRILTGMKKRGLVDWEPMLHRSIRIIEDVEPVIDGLSVTQLLALRGRIEARLVEQATAR